MLLQHAYIGDGHPPVHGLAHVVDGKQRDLHGGECFHLDPGRADRLDRGLAQHLRIRACRHDETQRHAREGQRVTERDQVAGFLGGHDAGDARNAEHVAFFGSARLDQRQGRSQHLDATDRDGHPVGRGLGADIDHVGLAPGIEVGQQDVGRRCRGCGSAGLGRIVGSHDRRA